MQFRLTNDRFPAGTTVGAYLASSEWQGAGTPPATQGPKSAAVDTAVADSTGLVLFAGLDADTAYWAVALIDGAYRWVKFRTAPSRTARYYVDDPEDVAVRVDLDDDQTANGVEVWRNDSLLFEIDADGVLHLAGVSAPAPLVLAEDAPIYAKAYPYSAVAGDTGDQTAAIQAALDAAEAQGGGDVYLGFGTFRLLGTLTIGSKVRLIGAGHGATILHWPTDLGSGNYAIDASGANNQDEAPSFADFTVKGPGVRSLGVQTCDMDGIKAGGNQTFDRVNVFQFRAGYVMWSDHVALNDCKAGDNFYNVLFPTGAVSHGNHQFFRCILDGATFACVAVEGGNILDGCIFIGGHVGFAPYGFYKFDGGAPSTIGLMTETHMFGLAFESLGNGAILDESTGGGSGADSIYGCQIINPGFSWNATYKIGARARDYGIECRNIYRSKLFNGSYPVLAGDVAAIHGSYLDFTVEGTFDQGQIETMFSQTGGNDGARVVGKTWEAILKPCVGTVVNGDLLEHAGGGNEVQRFQGRIFAGAALSGAVDGPILVAKPGSECSILSEQVFSSGRMIRPHTGTLHHGEEAPNYGYGAVNGVPGEHPLVAVSIESGGGAGGSMCHVRLLPDTYDRNYLRVQSVNSLPTADSSHKGELLRVEGIGGGSVDKIYCCLKIAAGTYDWIQVATG